MEDASAQDNLTASLLEEVFSAVELLKESEKHVDSPSTKSGPSFLAEEYSADLNAALGKAKVPEKKAIALKETKTETRTSNHSFIQEDEISDPEDPDPFKEGEGTKWITSTTKLNSSLNKPSNYFSDGTPKNGNKWADFKSVKEKLSNTIKEFDSPKDTLVDPVLYMNIINPKVSSTVLKARMTDRVAVPPFKIKKYLSTTDVKDVNWVTGGAIVGKFVTKSQKGNPYCIWTLSDLRGDIKTITVFLFGSAYKEFWKLALGVVVGILNPSLLENKNNKSEATLRVDRSEAIMVFGTSKDYGICKSKKNNGENCTAVVNKAQCEYCIYHVKQVYEKASRRPELQAHFTGKGLSNLRNKVLGKDEVFYAGKLYTASKGKTALSQSERLLQAQRMVPEGMDNTIKLKKDRELMQRLNGEIQTVSKSKGIDGRLSSTSKTTPVSVPDAELNKPKMGDSAVSKPKMIDLDLPITNKQVLRARANAIKYIRQNGPLKKPNDGRSSKRTPEQIKAVKRKFEAEEEQRKKIKTGEDSENNPKNALKKKLEKSGITEKFLELMNAPIENADLLKEAESEEREKYFTKLEFREKMEEKMATTYKIDCKAVRCLKCNYKSFSASELCKKERHPLKLVNAVKRFWKCGDCSTRTVSLELIPLQPCKTCGGSKWERASMLPEKKTQVLPNEKLSIRGHEEKFIGSSTRNPNINLLVPDEES
ncbi:UNVERIFIED_CONTAM: hypothetical protein PYX00_009565 [Menopon gallinae]|uniref:Protein MCM10 homolog n=1 Tax=Menopon gallinae TaxID=328185 RepID=A0AAW2HBT5_9NEOP